MGSSALSATAPQERTDVGLAEEIPDNCTITLPEGVTIPSAPLFPSLGEHTEGKDGNVEDVPPIGNIPDLIPVISLIYY